VISPIVYHCCIALVAALPPNVVFVEEVDIKTFSLLGIIAIFLYVFLRCVFLFGVQLYDYLFLVIFTYYAGGIGSPIVNVKDVGVIRFSI
jgi:hypothetical protein